MSDKLSDINYKLTALEAQLNTTKGVEKRIVVSSASKIIEGLDREFQQSGNEDVATQARLAQVREQIQAAKDALGGIGNAPVKSSLPENSYQSLKFNGGFFSRANNQKSTDSVTELNKLQERFGKSPAPVAASGE